MNEVFEETTEDYEGDKLSIVFRDYFLAIACISSS